MLYSTWTSREAINQVYHHSFKNKINKNNKLFVNFCNLTVYNLGKMHLILNQLKKRKKTAFELKYHPRDKPEKW